MLHQSFTLTKSEQQIMELLWSQNRSLSRAEIVDLCEDRCWKASSIHILLNRLLKKRAIHVNGFIKTGKNYGRTFAATISCEKYQFMLFTNFLNPQQSVASALMSVIGLLLQEEEIDDQTLDRLQAILQAKRSEMPAKVGAQW